MNPDPPIESGAPAAFGATLARLRRRAGLSQLDLALDAGVSPRHLSCLETGRSRPSRQMVQRLAHELGLSGSEHDKLAHLAGFAPIHAQAPQEPGLSPIDRLGLEAFQTAVALHRAASAQAAVDLAGAFFERLGVARFATGDLRRDPQSRRLEVRMDAAGRPAVGWLQHFRERGYRRHDALVAHTATAPQAFCWSDLAQARLTALQRRILDEAREFRIHDGFVLPIRRPDGSVQALTSWAERMDAKDPAVCVAARLVGAALLDTVERHRMTSSQADPRPRLEPRRRAALGWISDGRSLAWIAGRWAMDEAAVRGLLAEACLDLGVDLPEQAATRALALGLLDA